MVKSRRKSRSIRSYTDSDKVHWVWGFSMSEFAWDTEVVDVAPQQQQDEPDRELDQELGQDRDRDQDREPETLAICVDDFAALEERIVRAVELVKRERLSRAAAEERAASAEAELERQAPMAAGLEREVKQLRAERDHVRQRVEKLLSQLDALEL